MQKRWIYRRLISEVELLLNLPDDFLDNLRKDSNPVVKYKNFEFPPAQNTPQNVCYFKNFNFKAPADPDDKNYSIWLLPENHFLNI